MLKKSIFIMLILCCLTSLICMQQIWYNCKINDKESLKDFFNILYLEGILYFIEFDNNDILSAFYLPQGEAVLQLVYIDSSKKVMYNILEFGGAGCTKLDYNYSSDMFIIYWLEGFYTFNLHNQYGDLNLKKRSDSLDLIIPYDNIEVKDLYWITNASFVVEYYTRNLEEDIVIVKDTLNIPDTFFEKE